LGVARLRGVIMLQFSLRQVPNQKFSTVQDGVPYQFDLHYFRGVLYCSVKTDTLELKNGLRVVNNGWLIPYASWNIGQKNVGNFRFECLDDSYPSFENFGTSCFLRYYSYDEIQELNNG